MGRLKASLIFGACKGTTKGTPCRAREVFGNGYCKHHGGAGQTPEERRKQFAEMKELGLLDGLNPLSEWD
jgi:hypothetical protein